MIRTIRNQCPVYFEIFSGTFIVLEPKSIIFYDSLDDALTVSLSKIQIDQYFDFLTVPLSQYLLA